MSSRLSTFPDMAATPSLIAFSEIDAKINTLNAILKNEEQDGGDLLAEEVPVHWALAAASRIYFCIIVCPYHVCGCRSISMTTRASDLPLPVAHIDKSPIMFQFP